MTMSTAEARDHFSETINRVAYGKDRIILSRRGKDIAAIIPLEDLETLEFLEDTIDIHDARKAIKDAEKNGTISFAELKAELDQ